MASALPLAIRHYLTDHYTMTLATAVDGRPWAAAVFYACDEDLRFYFVSDPKTRHATQGSANPNVAAAIHAHDQSWQSIRGVQLEGRLGSVDAADRPRVEAIYIARFPLIGRMVRAATSDAERLVGQRLLAATFYVLRPGRLRFIDNSRGFGHKEEYVLDAAALHGDDAPLRCS
jgi:uncharacterized protein YhbP (UPF0306 family)